MYSEAVARVIRNGAPLATHSIDRRCLKQYTDALADESVQSLMCFCCARRFPQVRTRKHNPIRWMKPISIDKKDSSWCFFGFPLSQANEIFGLDKI